jgi:hypothetical protein
VQRLYNNNNNKEEEEEEEKEAVRYGCLRSVMERSAHYSKKSRQTDRRKQAKWRKLRGATESVGEKIVSLCYYTHINPKNAERSSSTKHTRNRSAIALFLFFSFSVSDVAC